MSTIVKKYGGTSVSNISKLKNIAQHILEDYQNDNNILVVLSAMGKTTDELIALANKSSKSPNPRDYDMLVSSGEQISASLLSIILNDIGVNAVAYTGWQAGIETDNQHARARISCIHTKRIKADLSKKIVVIVAGFQGINKNGSVTTLGRGGSDLSAVALAGALQADQCEIYSDVDGIYTTDPRIEPNAKELDSISYDEMLELSSLGAKVLQSRSVELAKKLHVKLYAKSSFSDNEGTLITEESDNMEEVLVSGVVLDKNQARVTVRGGSDRPGNAAEIFTMLAEANINVDMIIQNMGTDGSTNLGFTVAQSEHENAKKIMATFDHDIEGMDFDEHVCKVSVVGVGMKSHSGVAATAFRVLADSNINIQMISTSEIKVSMVIDEKYGELAIRMLHEAYELDK
jgi:aspartate kinase